MDFKSIVSTNSTTAARRKFYTINGLRYLFVPNADLTLLRTSARCVCCFNKYL